MCFKHSNDFSFWLLVNFIKHVIKYFDSFYPGFIWRPSTFIPTDRPVLGQFILTPYAVYFWLWAPTLDWRRMRFIDPGLQVIFSGFFVLHSWTYYIPCFLKQICCETPIWFLQKKRIFDNRSMNFSICMRLAANKDRDQIFVSCITFVFAFRSFKCWLDDRLDQSESIKLKTRLKWSIIRLYNFE